MREGRGSESLNVDGTDCSGTALLELVSGEGLFNVAV